MSRRFPISARDERIGDWPEDFSHENGGYECACVRCGEYFIGHKRRVVCRECAVPSERMFSGRRLLIAALLCLALAALVAGVLS